jgi:hypothetical protein
MAQDEGGRWDVSIKSDAVYLERFSDDDERVFDELLAPDEARRLAALLTKFADNLGDTVKVEGKDDDSGDDDEADSDEDESDEDQDESDDSKD